jgi:hypothetical protein
MRIDLYGSHNYLVAETLNEIGSLQNDMGKLFEAETTFLKAIGLFETIQGPSSFNGMLVFLIIFQLRQHSKKLAAYTWTKADIMMLVQYSRGV